MHSCPVCGNECDCDAALPTDEEVEETLPPPDCDHCDDEDEDEDD